MASLVIFLLRIYFGIFFKVKLVNMENIPANGAALLCGNHKGFYDMLFIGYKLKRLIRWMAKEELFHNPVMAFIMKRVGAFQVKRGKADVESIKTAIKLLEEGHIVGIFPQGTRIGDKDWRQVKIKKGAAMLAVRTGVPIIPVAVEGNYRLFGSVRVVFGKPFFLDIEKGKKYSNEELNELSLDIMKRVYDLLGVG